LQEKRIQALQGFPKSNSINKEHSWSSTSGVWALGEMRVGERRGLSTG
jgi:hypothetical protein